MPFTRLFVWVEGADDERFTRTILQPLFEERFDRVDIVSYAGMTKLRIVKWIESIRSIEGADYIFTADNDNHPCVSQKKTALVGKIKSLELHHVVVVVKEIESWYLAGLNEETKERLGIAYVGDTNGLDKEAFDELRSAEFGSRVDWMVEILNQYSLKTGIERNASLQYFVTKFLP